MASIWQIFGRGASSPTVAEFLHLSSTNMQRINSLTSRESHTNEPLNPYQCRSLSSKLLRTLENIVGLIYFWDHDSSSATSNTATLSTVAFENFYLVTERARELVESCSSVDWCQASTFQIQNEEAFKDILVETSLCYNTIYELVKDKVLYQDLRRTSTFEPPTSAEVMQDRIALLQRYQDLLSAALTSQSNYRKHHLARYLLRRLKYITLQSNAEDFDVCAETPWPDRNCLGDEWGKNSEFLGGNVCKTTWLDVPCAKKVFNDGEDEEILTEARILACLNHPNVVKFISCGHDRENSWHYIAMEHMEASLCSVIKKRTQAKEGAPFSILSAVFIMLQIAYGNCYLHDKGVAHRDLKTSNVVVRQLTAPHLQDYIQVKLVDFGLSKVRLRASRSNTISKPKIGTTVYRAPEAFQHGRANWFKADVYSFGLMCSVILSGEEPFQEMPRNKVHEAVSHGCRPVLPPETPQELERLIKECWDTDRNVRPGFVEICVRLAKLKHKLLREDPRGHGFKVEVDSFASVYIEEIIKKQSEARNQDRSHVRAGVLKNVIGEDEWSFPDQEVDIHKQLQEPNMISSQSGFSSPSCSSPSYGELRKHLTTIHQTYERFVECNGKSSMTSPKSSRVMPSTHSGIQACDSEQPLSPGGSSPLWALPGDLHGLKRQLVQLLNQNGGKMMLSKVPAEYNKLSGRPPVYLAEYNAQRLVHLIDEMKDTVVIKGDGTSKTLRLAKKEKSNYVTHQESGHVTYKECGNVCWKYDDMA